MKLTVSTNEVITLIRKTYNLPAEMEVVFIDTGSTDLEHANGILQSMRQFMSSPDSTVVNPAQKIASIKHLRTLIPGMGLAEAKWMSENWTEVTAFVKNYRMFPKIYGNGMYDYKLG